MPRSSQPPSLEGSDYRHELKADIGGRVGLQGVRFTVEVVENRFWFAMRQEKPALLPDVPEGSFYFGLWRFDCAELFLGFSPSGRYLEVNLAPNGAYWIGALSAPRQIEAAITAETWDVITDHRLTEASWTARIGIPLDRIQEALRGQPDRVNVTAVLNGCPDVDVPIHHLRSISPIDAAAPDFHVPDRFVTLAFTD